MKTAAIFFCAIVLCVHAISDDEVRRQWQEFQETYQKSYRSPVEARKRFTIFKQHLEEIEAHNKLYDEGKVTWKEGVNKFSDWTEDEVKDYINHGLLRRGDITVRSMPSEDEEIQSKWNEFKKTYGKSYRSQVEAKKRFEIFKKNVIRIEEHNDLYEQGLVSDKEAINQFSDWTKEEFEAYEKKGIIPEETVPSSEDVEIERKWSEFQKTYKKSYRSTVEAKKRFEIFKKNVIRIEEHNDLYEQGLVSDKEGINQFSDWTEEEFEAYEKKGIIPEETVPSSEDVEIERKWSEFQKTYKKSYRSTVEEKKRFEIFKKNVIRIEEHNDLYEQGLVSDKEAINQFSDWTEEEFEAYEKKGIIPEETVPSSEDVEIERKWSEFQKTYKKSYRSTVEAKKRFEIFKKNVIRIEEHNDLYEQGLVSDKEGINQFSDWTEEEFEAYEKKGIIPEETVPSSEDVEIERKWSEFQKTYKKSYRSTVEAKKRFEIFKKNVIRIEEHNDLYEQGLVSDKEGINQFSDWTEEEFEAYEKKGIIPEETIPSSEDVEIERKWSEFQKTYKKSYRSTVEEKKRFEIFKKNVIRIEEHNDLYEQGLVSDKEGINQFSDWTEEEFEAYEKKGIIPEETVPSSEDVEIERKWSEFQKTYKKSYRSTVEEKKRFEIFKKNVIRIEEHNDLYEQGLVSDKEAINQFSDWTEEEFEAYEKKGIIPEETVPSSEDVEIQRKWSEFQKTYKKSYRSTVEAKKRFEIFKNNVIKMEEHNDLYEQGLVSDKQGINKFADWTEEEFQDYVKKGLIFKISTVRDSDDEDMMRRFKDFQKKYHKSYKSAAEAEKRFEIFKENVKKIDEHNALYYEGKTTFLQEINEFSDWTHQEMIDWLIGH